MNHRLILLIMTLTIVFFLWGCSSKEKTMTNDQTHESLVSDFTAENLHSIGVSEYRLDSLPYKAQPEFLVFLSEEEEKKEYYVGWKQLRIKRTYLRPKSKKYMYYNFNIKLENK
ncbi:hypothetical protein [Brevibacillus agri]|uniref:hypothetical protein n=1 Tax=Brevibacillus agri TaxID=51101 RepID=UPI003D75FA56